MTTRGGRGCGRSRLLIGLSSLVLSRIPIILLRSSRLDLGRPRIIPIGRLNPRQLSVMEIGRLSRKMTKRRRAMPMVRKLVIFLPTLTRGSLRNIVEEMSREMTIIDEVSRAARIGNGPTNLVEGLLRESRGRTLKGEEEGPEIGNRGKVLGIGLIIIIIGVLRTREQRLTGATEIGITCRRSGEIELIKGTETTKNTTSTKGQLIGLLLEPDTTAMSRITTMRREGTLIDTGGLAKEEEAETDLIPRVAGAEPEMKGENIKSRTCILISKRSHATSKTIMFFGMGSSGSTKKTTF